MLRKLRRVFEDKIAGRSGQVRSMDKIHTLLVDLGATPVHFTSGAIPFDAVGPRNGYYYKFGPKPFVAHFNEHGNLCLQVPSGQYRFKLREPFHMVFPDGYIPTVRLFSEFEFMIRHLVG